MPSVSQTSPAAAEALQPVERALLDRITRRSAQESFKLLENEADATIARLLAVSNPGHAVDVFERFPPERRTGIAAAASLGRGEHWLAALRYPSDTVGRLLEPPLAVFAPTTTVREAIGVLDDLVRKAFITYGFVVEDGRLAGVLAFRELLFARPDQTLAEIMVPRPFALRPEAKVVDAMKDVVTRHFPAYPVVASDGQLVGMVRGQALFERQAFEISAQAGAMLGVEKEERVTSPWWHSVRSRHPWLQLNMVTAFIAAAVVGVFQDTIDRFIVLALFLGILSGQCANTGCQALAVTLRGMTLGDLRGGMLGRLGRKEIWVGAVNGVGTGLIAGIGMFFIARAQDVPYALTLGFVVFAALLLSCILSGISGLYVPLVLRKLGADPATASSIFVTTITDCASMGFLLGLATLFLPN
jgi:magnesium transporter